MLVFFQHLHVDDSVIHQHGVSDMDVVHEAVVVHIYRIILLAERTPDSEFKNIPRLQIQFCWQVARADRRPLRVQQNTAVQVQICRKTPDFFHNLADPIVGRVAHVQTKYIRSGFK